MRGKLNDRDAKCPFFLAHTRTDIFCESPIMGSWMSVRFEREEEKKTQYESFCCRRYKNCEMYRANMEKYEEE